MKKYLVIKKDGREESSKRVSSELDIAEFCESLLVKELGRMRKDLGDDVDVEELETFKTYTEEFCTVEEEGENLWTVGLNEEEWLEISEIK